jgi:hypothetical protein
MHGAFPGSRDTSNGGCSGEDHTQAGQLDGGLQNGLANVSIHPDITEMMELISIVK